MLNKHKDLRLNYMPFRCVPFVSLDNGNTTLRNHANNVYSTVNNAGGI